MTIKIKVSQIQIAKIRKGDIINLELIGSEKKPTELKVLVEEIVSDIQRCAGCGVKLNNEQEFKFGRQIFCDSCYERRLSDHRARAAEAAKVKKKMKPYWSI